MNKTLEQIEQELDAKIPRSVISERDGGGGRRLSYLEGHYVIDRLNKVFGHLGWDKEILEVTNLGTAKPSYLVRLRLSVRLPSSVPDRISLGVVVKEGIGYGSDKGTNNPHELAIKEAVTDALKVAAKDLGMSMGLALYDKTQENVDDEEETDKDRSRETSKGNQGGEAVSSRAHSPIRVGASNSSRVTASRVGDVSDSIQASLGGQESASLQKIEETIRSYVRIADKQKRLTSEEFKSRLQATHKVAKLAELTKEQMLVELNFLQDLTK